MDINHVIEALKSITVADGQGQALDYLKKISPGIGFPQLLLRLLHDEQLDGVVRQAAVIYFKNIVCQHWEVDDEEKRWTLNEQDKVSVKQQLIPAIIHAAEPIRIHLCTALQIIMRNDFPERWTRFADEILQLLRSFEAETRMGALFILHRLCKIYTREKENDALVELMGSALPLLQKRLETLIDNQDQPACIIQKQILKIFYCLNRFTMNLQILSIDQCTKWIHLFLAIVTREVPSECDALPEDERAKTVWWKCKKWALKIIQRVFERYGNEGNVDVSYNGFAAHYSRSLVVPVVFALKKLILDDRCTRGRTGVLLSFINDRFVSEEVIYFTLTYFSDAVHQALVWRALERNFNLLFKNVIFPLFQYSKKEEQMWSEDVEEFLRFKYDVYEDLHQPSSAASTFLQKLCKRQRTFELVLAYIMDWLVVNENATHNVRQTDAALHMLAIICPQWIKRKEHNEDEDVGNILSVHVDKLLHIRVIPRTTHENRFVRLRACYVLHCASEAQFENAVLERAIHSLIKCLKEDTELPVRVQSAVAIQSLINAQGTVLQIVRPHIGDLLRNVLNLIKMTRVEDLPAVVDTLVKNFDQDVIPIAYDVTVQLVQTFHTMVIGQNRDSVGVMGVLSTLNTNLGLFAKHPDIVKRVEPVIRSFIGTIFDTYCESYFEKTLSLTHSLVVVHVSPEMWTVFDRIYKGFSDVGTAFFLDCAPVFHAFLTNDTDNFLAVSERVQHFLAMCEKTLNDDEDGCDERTKAHAVKMLEVFLLQCRGRANHFIPDILRLVFNHLQKEPANENKLGDLKTQLLIAIVAALYCDFQMCSNLFGQMQLKAEMGTFEWVVRALYANRKNFEGVHNRKMLIWLLCRILADGKLPVLFEEQPEKFMEWLLTLFGELQRCIKELAERSKEKQQRSRMKSSTNKSVDDQNQMEVDEADALSFSLNSTDSEKHHQFEEETDLEAFSTPLDEQGENKSGLNVFVLFKHALEGLSAHNSPLLARITDQQRIGQERVTKLKHLMEICTEEENLENAKRLA